MSIAITSDNKFYTHAVKGLLEATAQRKDIESNFDRSKIQLYESVCKEQLKYAIELLKIGVDAELLNDTVRLEFDDGTEIKFQKDELIEQVGEQTFYVLFPKESDDDFEDEDSEILGYDDTWSRDNDSRNLMKNFMLSPMGMFFSMMSQMNYQPSAYPYQQPMYGDDPIKAVQAQLEELKGTKEKIRKKALFFKQQYEESKAKYESALEASEEENKAAIEKAEGLESERLSLSIEVESLRETISNKEKELEELNGKLDSGQKQIEELQNEISNFKSEIEQKNEKLDEHSKELYFKQQEIVEKEKEIESLKKACEEQNNAYEASVNTISELNSKIANLEEQITKSKEEINSGQNRLNSLQQSKESSAQKIVNLQNENNNLRNKNKEFERKNNELLEKEKALTEKVRKLEEKIEQYKEEQENISTVAYTDTKFEVGNASGFHKNFHCSDVDNKVLAYVDVCNMKQINAEWDEDSGDTVIRMTIEALSDAFGRENVYRIRGAQFYVVIDDGNLNAARDAMFNVKRSLNAKDFDIVFGLSQIDNNNKRETLERVMTDLKRMRNGIEAKNAQMREPGFPNESAEGQIYPYDSFQETPNGIPVANPNVSKEVIDNAYPYEETSVVQEVDATTLDLANQIMDMAKNR